MVNFDKVHHLQSYLPRDCRQDRGWLSFLLIMSHVPALEALLTEHVNFSQAEVNVKALQDTYLSSAQAFLLALALHLFNAQNQLPADGLLGMRLLDGNNFTLALHAIRLAHYKP